MFKIRSKIFGVTSVLFIAISILGVCAHSLGWYQDYWYADIILHTLSGIMFALFWIGSTYNETPKSKLSYLISIVMAGVFGSYLWELWEFGGAYILPGIAIAYTPNLADSLGDIVCGMFGALFIAGIYWFNSKK